MGEHSRRWDEEEKKRDQEQQHSRNPLREAYDKLKRLWKHRKRNRIQR